MNKLAISLTMLSLSTLAVACADTTEEDTSNDPNAVTAGKDPSPIPPPSPVPAVCAPKDCGPLPMIATINCDDGTSPPPPVCSSTATGKCGWVFGTCPVKSGTLAGNWGGDHISLSVSKTGAAHVELDCATGDFAAPVLDKTGSFSTYGTYSSGGGPVVLGGTTSVQKALYAGVVSGADMKLTITLDGKIVAGYALHRDATAVLFKCL